MWAGMAFACVRACVVAAQLKHQSFVVVGPMCSCWVWDVHACVIWRKLQGPGTAKEHSTTTNTYSEPCMCGVQ